MSSAGSGSGTRLVVGVLGLLLAGCGQASARVAPAPSGTPASPTAAVTPTPSPTPTQAAERVLATALDVPWDLAVLPDGSALVTLRETAEVVRVQPGGGAAPIATIQGVAAAGEGGLLGIAVGPQDLAVTPTIHLYRTTAAGNEVVSATIDLISGTLGELRPVLTGIPAAGVHDGGRLTFGPDGYLYVATGDAGDTGASQDTGSLAGKILRVLPDGGVPPDNPFGNEVWSYGHRNVQGFGWTGDGTMVASEFGQNSLDELNLITRGGNYGWPQAEGPSDDDAFIDPLVTWSTDEASPSGIAVSASGEVFVAALRGQRLWRTRLDGTAAQTPTVFYDGVGRLRAVELVGEELWLLTNNTARGEPGPDDDRLIAIQAP